MGRGYNNKSRSTHPANPAKGAVAGTRDGVLVKGEE
jgi:hypothetical protein